MCFPQSCFRTTIHNSKECQANVILTANQSKADQRPTTSTSIFQLDIVTFAPLCRRPLVCLSAPADTMSALTASARLCARQQLPLARASCLALQPQRRGISEAASTSSYDSPFKTEKTTNIPSFAKYRTSGGENSTKLYQYFLAGTFGAVTAFGAKKTVTGRQSLRRRLERHRKDFLDAPRRDWESIEYNC